MFVDEGRIVDGSVDEQLQMVGRRSVVSNIWIGIARDDLNRETSIVELLEHLLSRQDLVLLGVGGHVVISQCVMMAWYVSLRL